MVDGAFAGRKFVRGKVYGEVPPEEKKKFEEIKSEIPGNTGTNRKEETGKRKEETGNRKEEIGKSKKNNP